MLAVASVANGVAATTTASTVAAGVFIGSSTALAVTTVGAVASSSSLKEFANYGTEALISTAAGGALGGLDAYAMAKRQRQPPRCSAQDNEECFVAGTLIKVDDGSKAIEDIKSGDYVWACDEDTGEISLKRVVETYVNETDELIHIFVNGEEIITTPNHPFYAPIKGWTAACKLRAGDILVLVNGEYVVVEKVQHELLENPVRVYNFQVEDYHTYYVSNAGILVHNTCGYSAPKGGGGKTDTINVNGTDVTFGHGGRHLDGTGLNVQDVNQAIANDVVGRGLPLHSNVTYFDMQYAGYTLHYGAKRLTEILINVGTYYVIN